MTATTITTADRRVNPLIGIAYSDTVDLDGYEPGEDVDNDDLVIAELRAFRALSATAVEDSVIHRAAVANYREDVERDSTERSLEPEQFRALGEALLLLGLITRDEIEAETADDVDQEV